MPFWNRFVWDRKPAPVQGHGQTGHEVCLNPLVSLMVTEPKAGKIEMNSEMKPEQPKIPGSSVHPVEELQKKGIRSLRVIPESQLRAAAQAAVAQAILDLLDELSVTEEVRQQLRIRALQVLGNPDQQNSPSLDSTSESQTEAIISSPLVIPTLKNVSADVPVEQKNREEKDTGSPLGKREKALLLQLSKLIAQDWRSEIASVRDSHRDQVERLEVRIQELTQALQATDQVLESHPQAGNAPAEINNSFDHKKSELLDQLFQANVALRALSKGPSQGVSPAGEGEGR